MTSRCNRRMFLRGAGAAMAIPLLPSLLPRQARAAYVPPKRFVAMSLDLGVYESLWYPAGYRTRRPPNAQGFTELDLKTIDGPISDVIGASFDDLKPKLLLLRGLDSALHFPNSNGHMRSTTLTGTLLNGGQPGNSIDVVLSRSPKVVLPLTPIPHVSCGLHGENHSYHLRNGVMKSSYMHGEGKQLFQFLFGDHVAATPGEAQQALARRRLLVDSVLDDYRALATSPKLAKDDRLVLDEFVAHFATVEKRLAEAKPLQCEAGPRAFVTYASRSDTFQYDARMKEMLDILSLALKCGIVQVAQFGFPTPEIGSPPPESNYAIFKNLATPTVPFTAAAHTYSHEDGGNPRQTNPIYYRWLATFASYFMRSLDVPESAGAAGTFLDNAFVLYHNNLSNGSLHLRYDLPTLVGGSLGGRFTTGKFLDYTQAVKHTVQNADGRHVGVDYNRWLVTILRGFGLDEADYQQPGQPPGFGSDLRHSRLHEALDTAKRRDPLPGILRGG